MRVPVYNLTLCRNHCDSQDTTPEEIRALLAKAPGVVVLDKPEENVYPTPLQATGAVWDGLPRHFLNQTALTSGVCLSFVKALRAMPFKLHILKRINLENRSKTKSNKDSQ